MKILVSKAPNSLREYWDHPAFGYLATPRGSHDLTDFDGYWAADNDAYSDWSEERFGKMLDKIAGTDCKWVSAPDVVGDAAATLERFWKWDRIIAEHRLPIALVGQDGLVPNDVPWPLIDGLFIGGTTEWKLGAEARRLVDVAHEQGKHVHMGRVNSRRRLRYAKAIGCDSVDGTKYSRFTRTWLPGDLEFASDDGQMVLG